jgi:hypothetical protein
MKDAGKTVPEMSSRRNIFILVGSGTEDTHNATVTKRRTTATRASDSTREQCLKQVDGPAGGFFITTAAEFSRLTAHASLI